MKILIIKPSSLGDVIHSLPFLKSIKETFQDSSIDWVISKDLKEILEGHPLINKLIVIDKDSWKKLKKLPETVREVSKLIKTLRRSYYDMVIDLQGLLRSGLIAFFSRSSLKIGFEDAREGSRFFYDKKVAVNGMLHAVDKNLEIAKEIRKSQGIEHRKQKIEKVEFPLYIDRIAKENIKRLLGKVNEKEYMVIAPSARWETKRWPLKNFGMLISRLSVQCVIIGGSEDKQIAQQVMNLSNGKAINLTGKTNLKELVAIISKAMLAISNDSGPMHIAAALGVPVIAFFGPTDPVKTGPYGWQKNKDFKVIRTSIPCSPCFKKRCNDPVCMSDISVEMVLGEIKEYT